MKKQSPKKPNSIKKSTYECGVQTIGKAWVQFKPSMLSLVNKGWPTP